MQGIPKLANHSTVTQGTSSPGPHTGASVTHTVVLALRIIRWSIYGCALVALILLLHKTAPPRVNATPEAAARVEQKFQDVQHAVSEGQPATLRMNEAELNSYLASLLDFEGNDTANDAAYAGDEDGGSPSRPKAADTLRSNMRDLKVQLVNDRVKAYVVLDVHGKDMTLQLEGKLGADNGFVTFEPVSGQIGALPIPQATLEAAVRKLLEAPENRDKLRLPDDVSDLKIENGEVVAEYQ
jgi:hypothetical protein